MDSLRLRHFRALQVGVALSASITGALHAAPVIQFAEEAFARGVSYPLGNVNPQFGSGHALVDLDGDRDLDLVSTGAGGGIVGVFENDGTGHFTPRVAGSGIQPINASSVAASDYDNDGDLDLFIGGWMVPSKLYRNNGDFTFTDVTAISGVSMTGANMSAAWADINRDGHMDLYVSTRTGTSNNYTPNQFFVSNGDGTFTERSISLGIGAEDDPTLVTSFFDFDRDGDDDLYLGTDKGNGGTWWNRLYQNNGTGPLTEITGAADAYAYIDCMGIAVGDINNDGLFDVYMTDVLRNQLRVQNGSGQFVDMTDAAGMTSGLIGWGTVFADFDNDADLEVYVCNTNGGNRLYDGVSMDEWPAQDIAASAGVDTGSGSYNVAVGDIDNDGRLDMVVAQAPGFLQIFMNQTPSTNNWLRFRVAEDGGLAGAGVGTCLDLDIAGECQARQVRNGVNYKTSEDDSVHFGLGAAAVADQLRVVFPGNEVRMLTNIPANHEWTLYRASRLGDLDNDGSISKYEIIEAVRSMTGSGNTIQPGVEIFDMDGDFDIDEDDIAEMGIKLMSPSRLGTFRR